MVVETRYVAGPGLLLGSGRRWLLVTDPGDEAVVDELWATLEDSSGQDVDRVLALLVRSLRAEPPALALLDLSPGFAASACRGTGRVRHHDGTHVLTLEEAPAPDETEGSARRLVAGVVAARRAVVTVVPPPQAGILIDAVPETILAARGPDGPPPPRPRPEQPPSFRWDPELETGVSRTVARTPVADHLRHPTQDTVMSVSCPQGHLTPPDRALCRTCRRPPAPQEPRRVRRPVLGGLRLPTGEVVPLDRGVVLGRRPAPPEGSHDWPHLVHLPADLAYVSRLHLRIELHGWDVVARDLGSSGGTRLLVPGREPERLRPNEGYLLEPGHVLSLAEVYEVRVESGVDAP